jgi:hypothetical protein
LVLWRTLIFFDEGCSLSEFHAAPYHPVTTTKNPMYVDKSVRIDKKGIVHTQYFLHQSRREGQKIIKTTLLNITRWGEPVCEAFTAMLKNKHLLLQLAAFGYNCDKKKGKMQIVVGLLCSQEGIPVAVEVFEGNTNDTKTMHNQIRKTFEHFHAKNVVFVGDHGITKIPHTKRNRTTLHGSQLHKLGNPPKKIKTKPYSNRKLKNVACK